MTFEEAVEYALSEVDVSQAGAVDGSGASDDQPLVVLTSREREVATLVARGLSNRQVSQELSISGRTAANHVANGPGPRWPIRQGRDSASGRP